MSIRRPVLTSVALFAIVMSIIHYIRPAAIYSADGAFRPFGIGYTHKTILPIWVVSIVVAILSYVAIQSMALYHQTS